MCDVFEAARVWVTEKKEKEKLPLWVVVLNSVLYRRTPKHAVILRGIADIGQHARSFSMNRFPLEAEYYGLSFHFGTVKLKTSMT